MFKKYLAIALICLLAGCGHRPPAEIIYDSPSTQPPISTPTQPPTQPPSLPPVLSDAIGEISPEVPLSVENKAIIESVLNGPKTLDNRRHRILVAGDDYPNTDAALNYCVFDTQTRHLIGLVKKFKIDPANIRCLRNQEYN